MRIWLQGEADFVACICICMQSSCLFEADEVLVKVRVAHGLVVHALVDGTIASAAIELRGLLLFSLWLLREHRVDVFKSIPHNLFLCSGAFLHASQ